MLVDRDWSKGNLVGERDCFVQSGEFVVVVGYMAEVGRTS
jgi:hypothetical protein